MKEMMVNSKGQITIPKYIREHLGLVEGKKVYMEVVGGCIRIKTSSQDPIKALRGLAKGLFTKSSTELIRELRDEWK